MSTNYTQADLTAKKVNDLKQILTDLKLTTTGVKADLIARILEAQNAGVAAAVAPTDTATEEAPATSTDLPAAGNALGEIPAEDQLPSATESAALAPAESKNAEETKPLADLPTPVNTDKQSELEKRAARLARFGGNSEELAKLQRAEKFGVEDAPGLDDKTISKLDSELSNKRLPKNANGNTKKPPQSKPSQGKPTQDGSRPASKGGKPASSNKRPPPIDPAEEERRRKRAERFGAQA